MRDKIVVAESERASSAVVEWTAKVNEARDEYLKRYTFTLLKLTDPELHARLFEQIADFERATVTGSASEVEDQGAATVRGYRACALMLFDEAPGVAMVRGDGFTVSDKPMDIPGKLVLTTDDIAELLKLPGVRDAIEAMRLWPGARLTAHTDTQAPLVF